MSQISINEFTKITDHSASREVAMVYLWDIGPQAPAQPKRPEAPKGKEGEPSYELAKVDFDVALEVYKADLTSFAARKAEFERFDAQNEGPIEHKMWSVDARDALARDAEAVKAGRQSAKRWFMSARTRGFENLPNGGLPGTMKPGKGHEENMRREREGEGDIAAARKADPVFGQLEHAR